MINKNKKILIVAPYGFNDRLANFLEAIMVRFLAKNNWQVFCLARREKNEKNYFSGNIKIYRYHNLAQGIYFLLKIFIINRPAIVHVYGQRNNHLGPLAGLLAKLILKPLIFSEYGLLHDHYLVDDRDDPLGKPLKANGLIISLKQIFTNTANLTANLKNYLFHYVLTHADKIVFVSKHNLPLAKELGLKNYLYLPYILDNERWDSQKTEEDQDKNNPETLKKIEKLEHSRFCLFIGQLKLRKGWDIYLKAVPLVDRKIIPYFVLVTSSASQPPENFIKMAESLGVADRIIFFGRVSGQTLKTLYDLSSMVIVPSRYEGFGLIAVEAFAARKPLIASAVPALTEFVIDDYNGLLVPPQEPEKLAQAICRLATDKNLANKLVAGGQATLERLQSAEFKNHWLDFYEKLIAG